MGVVLLALRQSAKGRECTLRLPCCEWDAETTVLAHLKSPVKGVGNKGNDWHSAFACYQCHAALDQKRYGQDVLDEAALRGIERTQRYWFENGYLTWKGSK